jgi:hypothetical protein
MFGGLKDHISFFVTPSLLSMQSVSFQRKAVDYFFPEILVYKDEISSSDCV